MKNLIFAFNSSGKDPDILLMVASIRKFAGKLSNNPIWMLIPDTVNEIPIEIKEQLSSHKVQLISYKIDTDVINFPFAGYVFAAATAEITAENKTDILVWMNSDTLIINEPSDFLLNEDKNLAYRPVHHTLIGSVIDKPIDSFWNLIYEKCGVPESKIFPMKTHVDHNTLRPYFNAGCLVVRPEKGLFQSWWHSFKELYRDKSFRNFYEKDDLYAIFIHQAVLSGVILSSMEKYELLELPFSYNYPLHLYFESPIEYRPQNINDLITARFEKQKYLEDAPIHDPLKSWLKAQLNALSIISQNIKKKIKLGKQPIVYPIPIILAGALINNTPNFATLGDVGIMGIKPPIVFISSGQNHYTNQGILKHGTYSINFPSTSLLTKTDYCGIVSGYDIDKSKLFTVFFGELKTAPMIQECPVNLECKVIKKFSIKHRQIFVGEVIQSYVDKEFVIEEGSNKRIKNMKKLDPIIYALDNYYYKIGEIIGIGYQEGKKIQ